MALSLAVRTFNEASTIVFSTIVFSVNDDPET